MTKIDATASLVNRDTVSALEWETRVDLAAAFRMAHHFGWNDTIRNHIVARLPDEPEQFLINPRGLGWDEITASQLVKADLDGNILSGGDLIPGSAGFNFHRAVLRHKPALNCSLHVHPRDGVAVSAMTDGLQFYDQTACALYGRIAYHDFDGFPDGTEEGNAIAADLEDKNVMILRHHGLLSTGRTIGEAFTYMAMLMEACRLQVTLTTAGNAEPLPLAEVERTADQIWGQRQNTSFGALDWQMYRRAAERLDPGFMD